MKVILSPNPYRDRGLKAAQSAEKVLRNAGAETSICLPFDLEGNFDLPTLHYRKMEEELPTADVIVCFGGDGTILHAAKDALKYNLPVLGVNLGSVGFMAEVEVSEIEGYKSAGIIAGGMIPKIGGMADAIYQGVHEAVIIDGRVPHSILLELFSNRGSGTRFYRRSHQE